MLAMISYILKSYTSLSCVILYFRKKNLTIRMVIFLVIFLSLWQDIMTKVTYRRMRLGGGAYSFWGCVCDQRAGDNNNRKAGMELELRSSSASSRQRENSLAKSSSLYTSLPTRPHRRFHPQQSQQLGNLDSNIHADRALSSSHNYHSNNCSQFSWFPDMLFIFIFNITVIYTLNSLQRSIIYKIPHFSYFKTSP